MHATFEEHYAKISAVREYIKMIKDIADIPNQNPNEQASRILKNFLSMPQKRSYDYSLAIITLYGIFESFVEKVVCAYLSALKSQIKTYSQLPEQIRKNHTILSTKLIGINSSKYGEVKENEIIANLHSCLNQTGDEYKLNLSAFRQHTSNFRMGSLRDFFKQVGIDNIEQLIIRDFNLTKFIQSTMGGEDVETTLPISKYFEIVEDLVERRNVVAHGSEIDDLLSLDILDEYSEYISILIAAIYNALLIEYYSVMVTSGIAKNMGTAIKVYNNHIVCLNSANTLIKKGQVLIGQSSKNNIYWGKIESIQINRVDVDEVLPEQAIDIGMAVSFSAKETYTYYFYPNGCP